MLERLSFLNPYWLWALLALPALGISVEALTSADPRVFHILVHPTGEFSARFLIITMMATPLMLVLRGWRGPQWLKKNRRYFGVAAFGYALLHTLFYLIDKGSLSTVTGELSRLYIWTGWIAFLIFVPLAITSADLFVRKMGTWWKWVQRWTYAAAVLTLVHWAALHDWGSWVPAAVHFAPLIALESYRVWYWYLRPRPVRSPA
ncbi:MAG: ferric reductase-like transmembrane domain-containing protein [Marivita sp.]|uniref:sulfite oxidase heme-binding subunit YedZ n=1 Tax=Marivita sp. TaxID=2003365 RepID=UPI0025BB5208|nr:ferric reductase-like transmembrane domain-containing protein [Marivita sp.]MCI5111479.1 ferric reductase-like transmembrane domain-containing protein [Marivita sp.]